MNRTINPTPLPSVSLAESSFSSSPPNNTQEKVRTKQMPLLTIISPESIKKCKQMKLQPNDIFICSYPKSGTTWTQHIVISLLLLHRKLQGSNKHEKDKTMKKIEYDHVSDYAPFFEIDSHWKSDSDDDKSNEMIDSIQDKQKIIGRRIFNTHLRCDMLPTTTPATCASSESSYNSKKDAKFIYIIRSPLDVCVSFYHHLSHQMEGCYEKPFDDFFNEWMNGDIAFGKWTDHILSYAPYLINGCDDDATVNNTHNYKIDNMNNHEQMEKILLITYEEMKKDLNQSLQKIVQYLELDDYITSEHLEEVQMTFTFDNMKQNITKFQPKSVTWKNDFKFLRKGQVGDSLTLMTDTQMIAFKNELKEEKFGEKINMITKNSSCREKILDLVP